MEIYKWKTLNLFLIPLFIFTACPDSNICSENDVYYNYGGKEVSLSLTLQNNSSEDISLSLNPCIYSKKRDYYWNTEKEVKDLAIESKTEEKLTFHVMDNYVLFYASVTANPYQSMIGTITYKDGSSKKFTGYDFDSLSIPSLNKDDFELSGFGYYKINTSVENADNTFGTFVSPDENANGIKEGVIYLTIEVNDEGLSYSYANE